MLLDTIKELSTAREVDLARIAELEAKLEHQVIQERLVALHGDRWMRDAVTQRELVEKLLGEKEQLLAALAEFTEQGDA
jgi:hypothetical protein